LYVVLPLATLLLFGYFVYLRNLVRMQPFQWLWYVLFNYLKFSRNADLVVQLYFSSIHHVIWGVFLYILFRPNLF
jgi:hypothetical protein